MIGSKGQAKAILDYLKAGNTLTTLQSYQMFGCTRLAAKIFDLRKAGYNIVATRIDVVTRYGTTQVCQYKLIS